MIDNVTYNHTKKFVSERLVDLFTIENHLFFPVVRPYPMMFLERPSDGAVVILEEVPTSLLFLDRKGGA